MVKPPDGATLVGAVAATIDRWDATTGKSLIPEGGNSTIDQIGVMRGQYFGEINEAGS